MIVEAMIQSMKSVRSVNDFYSILNAISNNIDTNMSTNEMLSFYNVAKNLLIKSGDVNLNITKTYLTGYDCMFIMVVVKLILSNIINRV